MNDFTIDNIIDVLADFVEPICGEVLQAQVDRVPMPKGQFCIMTPLRFTRLSTTREINKDTGSPSTSAIGFTEVRQADIQIDIYGDDAGGRAIALETVFRTAYAYDAIKAIDSRLAPLYSTEAIQAPMINAENQWQERYMLTVSLQAHITIDVPQDYFDKAKFTINQADKANP
ncbi:phage neck terminator protein [Erwinia sp. V71]|uniref:phage neck terminator protein n=1 Tax=Erwinia sp. V71 TaxID=3369424 RepID=UPI003F62810B